MSRSDRRSPNHRRRGFALPAVLAVTGVVTLIFLVAITALASLSAEANSARARMRFLQRALTAEAALSFMAATEPMKANGLSVNDLRTFNEYEPSSPGTTPSGLPVELVRLDGRSYLMDIGGPLVVRLQDQAGMINLAQLRGPPLSRFMERIGVEASLHDTLAARYQDYFDLDDLRQINGAERADYADGGPPNRPILRPSEWLSVLGARDAVQRKPWVAIKDRLASDPISGATNINTASAEALTVWFDLTENQAAAVLREREITPFFSINALETVTGALPAVDYEQLYTFPADSMIVTIRDTRSAWTYRARLSLTPSGLEQPVWIDQTELTEAPRRAVADTSNATRLSYTPR